ncbi:MAG: peptidylprolyl isomerase [Thermoanaerobaculales bacterium]|nr:peptidylprolyl isomerase [Thermoanaerobaculales bacterium]
MGDRIAKDAVVAIDYRLTVADGTEVDTTADRGPMEYLHGHQNIIPGLEQELEGHEEGDTIDVTVAPKDGYGEHEPERVVQVNREQLGFEPEIGSVVSARLPDGREQHLLIAEIEGETVTLDGNHPLAGQTLRFEVSIASIREATEGEIANGSVG